MRKTASLVGLLLFGVLIGTARGADYLEQSVLMTQPCGGYALPTLHIRNGFGQFFSKLNRREATTVVYLGGSITNHEGYRKYSTEWLKTQYPNTPITSINAGIGGTGSDLGVYRLAGDVLKHNPDLVVVEFAVNDGSGDSAKISNSMEGIVRQIKQHDPNTDICFVYTINEVMLPDMEAGKLFKSMRLMEHVANHYQIPSVNFGVEVTKLKLADQLVFTGTPGTNYGNRILFTTDKTHPTLDQGHKLYNEILTKCIDTIRLSECVVKPIPSTPLYPTNFEKAKMYSPKDFTRTSGWIDFPSGHSFYNTNRERCPQTICTNNSDDEITIYFKGRYIGIYDIMGPSSCGITLTANNGTPQNADRFDVHCYYYRNNNYLFDLKTEQDYQVKLKRYVKPSLNKDELVRTRFADKITSQVAADFNNNYLYIGQIMLMGDLLPSSINHPTDQTPLFEGGRLINLSPNDRILIYGADGQPLSVQTAECDQLNIATKGFAIIQVIQERTNRSFVFKSITPQ